VGAIESRTEWSGFPRLERTNYLVVPELTYSGLRRVIRVYSERIVVPEIRETVFTGVGRQPVRGE